MKLKKGKERVLIISDTQIPFHHRDTFAFLEALKKKYKPTKVVHIGDVVDQHALSDYDTDPDGFSAGEELRRSIKYLKDLYKLFPKATVLTSNHDIRVYKKARRAGIPTAYLRHYSEWLEAPEGWKWKDREIIDGIIYEHGEACGGKYASYRAAMDNMRSTVIGHHHANFQINYAANKDELVFGMGVGCLVDNEAYAFAYGKIFRRKPIIGTGVVIEGQPILHPMYLTPSGRWTGKL